MFPTKQRLPVSAPRPDGGWLTPEVAAAQRQLVDWELNTIGNSEPYAPLGRALGTLLPAAGSLVLDAGCGVGHYGTWLKRAWPELVYLGTDYSAHMIAQAQEREPGLTFGVCEFGANAFEQASVVLVSQCLELQDDPWLELFRLLRRAAGAVILHKIRLAGESGFIDEPTYAGHMGQIYLWSLSELERFITAAGRRWQMVSWGRPDIVTVIVWPT